MKDAVASTVTVKPSIKVEESYDSNANYGNSEDQKGDFVTSITPTIDFSNDRKRLALNGNYSLSSRYYSHEPELGYTGHNGNIGIRLDLSQKSSMSLSDSVSYSKDTRETDGTGIQTSRTGILSNNATIALSHRLTGLTSLTLRGSDSFSKFDDSDFIDSRTNSGGIDLSRQLTSSRSVNASYTYTNFNFENRVGGDLHTQSLQIGLTEQFSTDLSLTFSSGVVYSGEIGDNYDWTAQAGLSKRFHMSSVTASYSRGVTTSSGLTDEINISDRGTMRYSQTLTRTVNIALSGGYSENHTEPAASLSVKSYDAAIRADWRPVSWISLGGGYSRFQQWVEGPQGTELSRDMVSISVTAYADGWRF